MMLTKRCGNCIISLNYPGVKFDENGICNYCREEKLSNKVSKNLRKDFEKTLKNCKGKIYDCLIGLSGGKDSAYLLYLAKEKFKLRCLTFTVDNGLMSKYAKENIKMITDEMGIEHINIKPPSIFYKKFYKKLIKDAPAGYMESVCASCSELFHSFALRIAVEKEIPLIFFAYSPDQVTKYFYEIPRKEILEVERIPKAVQSDEFTDEEKMLFWNPKKEKINKVPRVLFPYHVIPYPGIERIERFLKENGLIGVSSPLYTNCSLSWLTLYLDIKKNGFNPLEINYSRLIRCGKTNRWKWLIVFSVGNFLLKNRLVKRKEIKESLRFLDMKLKELKI